MRGRGKLRVLLVAIAACAMSSMAFAPVASADLKLEDTSISLTHTDGTLSRDAGGHPDLRFRLAIPKKTEMVHDIDLALPPGFVGDPTTTITCSPDDLLSPIHSGSADCPVPSQIGTVKGSTEFDNGAREEFYVPLFNMTHGPQVPARFGFLYLNVATYINAEVRPGDYGITSGSRSTSQTQTLEEAEVTIWGVPQDAAHNRERVPRGVPRVLPNIFNVPVETPPAPFLRNPTSCSEDPATFTAAADSWENRGAFDVVPLTADADGAELSFEGCESLPFEPSASAHATSSAADSPSGFVVDIDVPQSDGPYGHSASDVRKVVTTLPKGMAVSASSAAGLGSCSPAEIGIGTNDPPTCPDSSKLGTVTIDTPLLDEQLQGSVYLAKQNDNPFNSLLALYLGVKGPGFYLKLPGKIDADPNTGQLTATFADTPQLPFEHLRLEMKSGPRAPLTTPRACGTYNVRSEFVPWSGTAPVVDDSSFTISADCGTGGFSPGLRAGTKDATAGGSSPFTLQVTRKDGEQNLAALDVTLPEGLLAKLAGVQVCGNPGAATGNCPPGSQVGRTTVGAGSGPTPVYVPETGKAPTAAYLAGPYKGAPYSLVVKVPAQAGPFDLGTVAVRSGIYVDPVTTAVSVKSDPLPQILQGIPIAYRDVRVEIDRDGFMRNPTSCEGMKVASTIFGSGGATANPAAKFAVVNCDRLGFKPKLALEFSGPTHRSAHPALKATLRMPKGGANIAKASVSLPRTEFLENAHIGTVCTRVQYAADQCPQRSVYGYAKAWTPLLDKPLQGPIYLRSSNHLLPDLVASLDGQIHVDLAGRIDSPHRRIRTTFWAVPDAPVSKVLISMKGGDKGLLVNNTELCRTKPRARAAFTGQNGKRSVSNPLVKVGCGKSPKKRK
ncbi:MAG TPA: hypothetical protein VFJ61_07990 [Solirubrobacterales bacterium]|nr:hypothetical protein [Solirubrobacterales bacterium]